MEIIPFEPEMAAGLARCYNDLTAGVPHAYPVTAAAFASLESVARPAACREDSLLVAREKRGEIVGFVHLAEVTPVSRSWYGKGEPALIRYLAYRPGRRAAGQALLEAAESWARGRHRPATIAGHTICLYPSHLPCAHLSERLGHVHALFGRAGYSVYCSEVFFEWRDFDPPANLDPVPGVEIAAERHAETPLGWLEAPTVGSGVIVRAMRQGGEAGRCITARLSSDYRAPDAPQWCFCYDLGVEESLQGRGVGRLLLARSLAEMRRAGCRHALISTNWDNYRAYLFYTNFGYRFLDRTFGFRKQL